ncbi:hypothetical protein ACU4GD_30995 [Cupriavidus basilensis]
MPSPERIRRRRRRVVNAGAMGFITARSFDSVDALRSDLRRCQALTDGRPFGVNLTLSRRPGANKDVAAWIQAALAEGDCHFEERGFVARGAGRSHPRWRRHPDPTSAPACAMR